MQKFGLAFEEIDDALGGSWVPTLWGCAFEDFLTRRFEPDDENPVEIYLRRHGWKERALTRSYMAALQTSVMSLYEVSDLMPGQSFRARDLIRGGEPVLVSEHTATRTLKPWDRIAARIVRQGPKMIWRGIAGIHAGGIAGAVFATGGSLCASRQEIAQGRALAGRVGRMVSARTTSCDRQRRCSPRPGFSMCCRAHSAPVSQPSSTAKVTKSSSTP